MKSNSVYKDVTRFSGLVFLMGLIEFIIFTVFLSFRIDILIGVLYGCIFVCINFLYLAFSLKKSLKKDASAAKTHMALSANIRVLLIGVALVIAAKASFIHFWAAIVPLFFQRIAIHIISFINNKGSENS